MRYRITVRGRLADAIERRIADVTAEVEVDAVTYIVDIADQADLYGILGAIQRSGVELLSINTSETDD